MSFKIGRFFHWMINFILGTFFLTVGILSLLLPWSSLLRTELVQFILEDTLILSLFGLGLILIGLSILIYSFLNTKRQYASIQTGPHAILVDENLIQQYLEKYWKEQFPHYPVSSDLVIKKRSIHVKAEFPFLPASQQEEFLNRVQEDFTHIFGRILGYPHEVYLTAIFQTEKSETKA